MSEQKGSKNTEAVRKQMNQTSYREHSTPLFLTSSFVYHDASHAAKMFAGEGEGDIYSRFSNPNTTELIEKFCLLEEMETGIATASGMAAIFNTLAAHLKKGDHVVAGSASFGNTLYILKNILPNWGINYTLVNTKDRNGWETAITPQTKMVLIETPTNPGLEIVDIKWLSEICKSNQAIFCVDNCFATPFIQKPGELGADIVIHSATKWIDGQGRVLGGLVLGSEELIQPVFDFLKRTGASMSPFNAWILSKSTETLAIRMERHCSNALQLALWLEEHPKIRKVRYPFLKSNSQYDLARSQMKLGGGIVTLDLNGDQDMAFELINNLKIPSITANLGDTRTIITHPATTTHSKLTEEDRIDAGILAGTLRISVGLEKVDDLIGDFEQALNSLK